MTPGAWLHGFFAGYETDSDFADVVFRWLALAAVVIGAGLFVVLSHCLIC